MNLRDELTNTFHNNCIDFTSEQACLGYADAILALPEMVELREKAEKYDESIPAKIFRELENLRDSQERRNDWLRAAKKEAGYTDSISFDVVWDETKKKAGQLDLILSGLVVWGKCDNLVCKSNLTWKDEEGVMQPCVCSRCHGTGITIHPATAEEVREFHDAMFDGSPINWLYDDKTRRVGYKLKSGEILRMKEEK